jgi:hypothetical protein
MGAELGQHDLAKPLSQLEHKLGAGDGGIRRPTHATALCTPPTAIIAA